jgi:uncharacterized membrane protein YqhA
LTQGTAAGIVRRVVRRVLGSSRFFIAIAVVGSFLAAATALVFGGVTTVAVAVTAFAHRDFTEAGAKHLAVQLVTMIDLFLLGTVLYIVAIGLYELFIDHDVPMPRWLRIATIDDLKERLLSVVTVLLAVTFLGSAVTWQGADILQLGLAVGVVLAAVALLLRVLTLAHAAHPAADPVPGPDGPALPDADAAGGGARGPAPSRNARPRAGPPTHG